MNEIIDLGHSNCKPSFNFCERKIGQPYLEIFRDLHFLTKRISENVVRMTQITIENTLSNLSDKTDISLKVEHKNREEQLKDWLEFDNMAYPTPTVSFNHYEPLPEGVRFEAETEHPYALVTVKRIVGNQKIVSVTTYQDVETVPESRPIDRPQ